MKKMIFGTILIFVDLVLIIGGLTCLIIGSIMYHVAQDYQAQLVNVLFALGFVGVGSFSATLSTILGALLVFSD